MIDALLFGELQQAQQLNVLWVESPSQTQVDALNLLAQTTPARQPGQAPIVLGQPENLPYVVIVPTSDSTLLVRVRQFAAHAFLTRSRWGFYIQAGAFGDRAAAERLNRQLRDQGFDVRVVFLRAND